MAAIGYKFITKHGHPNAYANGKILEHVFTMAEMLGRALTKLEVVHHIDGNKGNNHISNLQLFATQAAHLRHHAEERALAACGNRLFMRCSVCKEYDDPSSMYVQPQYHRARHSECHNKASRDRFKLGRQTLPVTNG